MLKIAVDDPGYLYVVSYAGHCCHKRAVAADEHVYPYAGRGGLVEFFHHLFVGDMVYLYLDPGLFSLAGSPDLVIDESNKAFAHIERRDKQMAECLLAEGSPDYVEHLVDFFFDLRVGGHHEIIGVHTGVSFMKISGPCHADIGSVPEGDVDYLGMDLQTFRSEHHVHACILHLLGI